MAKTTRADLRLSAFTLATLPLLEQLRRQRAACLPETCLERARHITTYLRDLADPAEPGMLTYAKAVRCYLTNKAPRFFDANLLAGTTTSKPWGAPVYPEWLGVTLWPGVLNHREGSPRPFSPEEVQELDQKIVPFWRERRVLEATRARLGSAHATDLMFRLVRFIGSGAGTLSRPVPCATVVLERGLGWVMREAGAQEATLRREGRREDAEAITFYQAVQEILQGLLAYAGNLGRFAVLLAVGEPDPERRRQLAAMAEVCAQVPAGPARNFREAVNALWLLQVGFYAGSIDPALSPGRWDQILAPMYVQDVEAGLLTSRAAMDLLGCLWLKLHDNTYGLSETMEELFGGLEGFREGQWNAAPKEDPGMMGPQPDLTSLMRRVTELLTTQDLGTPGSRALASGTLEVPLGEAFRHCPPDGLEEGTLFEKLWNTFRAGRRFSTIS